MWNTFSHFLVTLFNLKTAIIQSKGLTMAICRYWSNPRYCWTPIAPLALWNPGRPHSHSDLVVPLKLLGVFPYRIFCCVEIVGLLILDTKVTQSLQCVTCKTNDCVSVLCVKMDEASKKEAKAEVQQKKRKTINRLRCRFCVIWPNFDHRNEHKVVSLIKVHEPTAVGLMSGEQVLGQSLNSCSDHCSLLVALEIFHF